MASMQAELKGAKRVPKTNAKKCMQNRFPDNGPPLFGSWLFCVKTAMVKVANEGRICGPKNGCQMFLGPPFWVRGKSKCRRFRGLILGPPGGPKNGAADLYCFKLSKEKLSSDMGVGGSVDDVQLYFSCFEIPWCQLILKLDVYSFWLSLPSGCFAILSLAETFS